jgi:hypothetical protein
MLDRVSRSSQLIGARDKTTRHEAEELEVQVMETRKRVLGAEHPDTLTSMGNLAFTCKSQGRDLDADSRPQLSKYFIFLCDIGRLAD